MSFLSVTNLSDLTTGWAVLYAVIGFVIVIAVLIVLVLLLMLLSRITNLNLPKKGGTGISVPEGGQTAAEDYELVAVITAAVSAAMSVQLPPANDGNGTPPPPFVIRSIKKI